MVVSIWAMPCPSPGCFVMTKSTRQHKIVKGAKLQKSEFSHVFVVIAEGSANALPVFISTLVHFCIAVSLHYNNVLRCFDQWHSVVVHKICLFRCYHSLKLGPTLVLLRCWKETALRRMVISLLETRRHPMTVHDVLVSKNANSCLSSFPLKKTMFPSSVVASPKFFHLISRSKDVPSVSVHFVC